MPHWSDDIYLGKAYGPNMESGAGSTAGSSPMDLGVGPLGRIYIFDSVPLTKQTSGLATAQAVAGAANLTLTAGTGVTSSVDVAGLTRLVLDCPRAVDILSSDAGDTTQTATVSGYDQYGQPMSELIAFNGTSRVAGKKAFKSVWKVAISAAMTGNASVGTTDVIGLPVRVTDKGYVGTMKYNNVITQDTSTVVVADTTSPATTTTGDVRGTVSLSGASDGSKRLIMGILLNGLACGPNSTRAGAFGVTQA